MRPVWGRNFRVREFLKTFIIKLTGWGAAAQVLGWIFGVDQDIQKILVAYPPLTLFAIVMWGFYDYVVYDCERQKEIERLQKNLKGAARRGFISRNKDK